MLCGWAASASAGALDVVPVLLGDSQVGIVVKNTSAQRAQVKKILVNGEGERGARKLCALSFDTSHASFAPGEQRTLMLPGFDLDVLAGCLPPGWNDTFDLADIAEISTRKRGCVSCDYQLGVWAWNAAVPFEVGYEAMLGYREETGLRRAYVHFWRKR
ncbi:hypothetical protein GCM10023144_21690 [Pigmentiphaga soli]|uniref:Uncharacterized protein n=2 Tax=Pigmentiphaga soli TaxID=1007095 RepID=A0ABP8GZD0_9BURK